MSQDKSKFTRKTAYLDALKERVLVFDGAMGTTLQTMNLTEADFGGKHLVGCNDCLVLNSPDTIAKVHSAFLEAGADVIETDTFRANRLTLADYGLADRTLELNIAAARLARRVADSLPMIRKCRISAMTSSRMFSANRRLGSFKAGRTCFCLRPSRIFWRSKRQSRAFIGLSKRPASSCQFRRR